MRPFVWHFVSLLLLVTVALGLDEIVVTVPYETVGSNSGEGHSTTDGAAAQQQVAANRENICPICLKELEEGSIPFSEYKENNNALATPQTGTVITTCGHKFCGSCLLTNYRHGRNRCPICNAIVAEDPPAPPAQTRQVIVQRRRHAVQNRNRFIRYSPILVTICGIVTDILYSINLPVEFPTTAKDGSLTDAQRGWRQAFQWIMFISSIVPLLGVVPGACVLIGMLRSWQTSQLLPVLFAMNNVYIVFLYLWYLLLFASHLMNKGMTDNSIGFIILMALFIPFAIVAYQQSNPATARAIVISAVFVFSLFFLSCVCLSISTFSDLLALYGDLWDPVGAIFVWFGLLVNAICGIET